MNVGRLYWRTPTGAMLWEIWGRHRVSFLWHGVALGACLCFVQWKRQDVSEILAAMLALASVVGFVGGYLQLLSCFAYLEVDLAKVNTGYPSRLLLKPLRTFHLVMMPMLVGGLVTTTMLYIWGAFVLKPLGFLPAFGLFWISTVLLSFFWWMQAFTWSIPAVRFRSFVIGIPVTLLHLIVGVMPQLPFNISPEWQWGILSALLVSAAPCAWVGLKLIREGRWDGPSRISTLWDVPRFARTRAARKKFHSAFAAQFWLEWQRQGWLLPGLSGAMSLLVLPFVTFGFKWAGVDAPRPEAVLAPLLIGPPFISGVMGPVTGKFDHLGSTRELPGYIPVRPMTNGGFVMAKLTMAFATSALAWLLTVAGMCLCLAISGKGTPFKAELAAAFGPVSYLTGCVSGLLLLVMMTWKNLLAGIATGLTGRTWIANLAGAWRGAVGMGLMALVMAAKLYGDFRESLLHCLTEILVVCLVAKIAVSTAAFVWGMRRKAITACAVGWIVGGWLGCGLFVAGYAGHVCNTINQAGLRIWVTLGGFLILPLADLAIAPLALAWNRHR